VSDASEDALAFVASPGVVPVRSDVESGSIHVTLARVGAGTLEGAFYEDAIRAFRCASAAPLETRRVALGSIDGAMPFEDALPLAGLVFHVSRTGSSLVVRMLAHDPRTVVVPESPVIDDVVMRTLGADGSPLERAARIADLRRVVALHARARSSASARVVLKLDAWHLCASDLFLEAFPDVPVVVLVRDPLDVVASQRARRGRHVVPGLVAWERLGVRTDDVPPHDLDGYAIRVLGAVYDGASRLARQPRARVVRYEALPGAVDAEITPWLGLPPTGAQDAGIVHRHAKEPSSVYDPAIDVARSAALDEELRARIATELSPRYRTLLG
jgi:hypothetical protein